MFKKRKEVLTITKRVSEMTAEEYEKNRKYNNEYQKQYRKDNPEKVAKIVAKYQKTYYHDLKFDARNAYGGRCSYIDSEGVQCPKNTIDNLDELEIHHADNNGKEHMRSIFGDINTYWGWKFDLWLRRNNYPQDLNLQVLCKEHHDRGRRRMEGKLNDPIWLKKKYIDESLSLREIAKISKCSAFTIRNRLIEFGISRKK